MKLSKGLALSFASLVLTSFLFEPNCSIALENSDHDLATSIKLKVLLERLCKLRDTSDNENQLACVLIRLHQFDEAKQHLLRAMQLNKSDPQTWEDLGFLYCEEGKFAKAADAYERFLVMKPRYSNAASIKDLISRLKEESKAAQSKESPDYFDFLVNKQIWRTERMPIKVAIENGSGLKNYKDEYQIFAHDAFLQWSKSSNEKINFEFVNNPDAADITLKFIDDPNSLANTSENGDNEISASGTNLEHVDITILTVASGNRMLNSNAIKSVILHEIGHAIGLDHSANPKDVMFGFASSNRLFLASISERDASTLRRLYAY